MVVVFPAPLGPSRLKHSPGRTSRSRPSTATTSPQVLRRPRRIRAGEWGDPAIRDYTPVARVRRISDAAARDTLLLRGAPGHRVEPCHGGPPGPPTLGEGE